MNSIEGEVRKILYDNFAQTQWEGMGGSPDVKSIGQTIIVNQAQLDRAFSQILKLTNRPLSEKEVEKVLNDYMKNLCDKQHKAIEKGKKLPEINWHSIAKLICSNFSKPQIKYPEKKKLKEWFEANYLDGDKIQDGQMIASAECFEAILQAIALNKDLKKED